MPLKQGRTNGPHGDTMHPGRSWAVKTVEDAMPEATIRIKLTAHFTSAEASRRLFNDRTDMLNAFIEGLKFS
jgi:hypothetical protein